MWTVALLWACAPPNAGRLPPSSSVSSLATGTVSATSTGESLVGLAWGFVLAEAAWLQPAGVGDLFAAQMDWPTLLLAVVGGTAESVDIRLGYAIDGAQDPCAATADVVGVSVEPELIAGPYDLPIVSLGGFADLVLPTLELRATAGPGTLTQATLTGLLDVRAQSEVLGLGSACDAGLCVDCGDGALSCLDLSLAIPVEPWPDAVDPVPEDACP